MRPNEAREIKEKQEEVLASCYGSLKSTCYTLFPDIFFREFGKCHEELFEKLEDPTVKKLAVLGFRGMGKTSLILKAFAGMRLLFKESHFICPLGCTYTHAEMQSENLKIELTETNDTIKKMFGSLKDKSQWTKERWRVRFRDGVLGGNVMPRSSKQQVRGLLLGNHRPDLWLADDIENPKYIENEEHRKETVEWFFSDVMYTLDLGLGGPLWKMVVSGTVLHEDSLVLQLQDDPAWEHINIPLCDDDFKSVWPAYMTDDMVKAEYEEHRRRGTQEIFYRERRNLPMAPEDKPFKKFIYYKQTEKELNESPGLENIVILDPAKTKKLSSAETGIVGCGIDIYREKIKVREAIGRKMFPDEMYKETLGMCARINASVLGVEVTSLHEFIIQPLRNEISRLGLSIELVELHARGHKIDRIRALIPYYSLGSVEHNEFACVGLEVQLLSFPRSKRWDLMDCLAYVVLMMAEGDRYFTKYNTDKMIEKEFEKIEEQDRLDKKHYDKDFELEEFYEEYGVI